jgi:hypothetical protein
MTMLRRTAQGRLSELFGARTPPIDSSDPSLIFTRCHGLCKRLTLKTKPH